MHKKYIIVLILVTALTFVNCLANDFVGDDEFLFIKNPFFHSLSNFPLIFTSNYIADQDAIFNDQPEEIASGSVAYRPVLSMTFFLDYWLWQDNPFGYHLTNVLIHLLNSILVYILIFTIMGDAISAFIGALLFALHPLKSEAVASIGYRADSLACLFLLLSFLSYVKEKRGSFFLSHIFFLFALFTKESAVVYPALIMTHDWLIKRRALKDVLKGLFSRYLGFVAVLGFYLYVYVYIFPNSSFGSFKPMAESLSEHVVTILQMFGHYITVFMLPFLVKVLPPLYTPVIENVYGIQTWISLAIVLAFFIILFRGLKTNKPVVFFLLWFLFCFIPVSNIIAIANPMAYRFMYLPSVGLSAVLGIFLLNLKYFFKASPSNAKINKMITTGFIIFCSVATILLNFNWRNNTMMALSMVNDFPKYPVGYLHAGMAYFNAGEKQKATELLTKGVNLGLKDPRGLYLLALSSFEDHETSRAYFEQSIREYPTYVYPYIGIGRIELFEKDYDEALRFFEKSIELSPNWKSSAYVIQLYMLKEEASGIERTLIHAKNALDQEQYGVLLKMTEQFEERDKELPFDLGI